MRETEEQAAERERAEFTDDALAQFRQICAARGCVPAALIAVSPAPAGGWMLHVASITDGPVADADVLEMLGERLGDLIRELRAADAKGKGGAP